MTREQAEFVKEACDSCEITCNVQEGYSGRFMYGERTWSVVVPSVLEVLGTMVAFLKNQTSRPPYKQADPLCGYPQLDNLRWDHMGKSDVILY